MKTIRVIPILLLVAPPVVAQPADDPWAQVPALPTSCYTQGDTFQDQAYAATEALGSEKSQKDEINETIAQQYREVDIMELQQRMMTFMMEHPEDAQRVMMAMQQGGLEMQEQSPEMLERSGELEAQLRDLTAQYDAALHQAIDPIETQRQTLRASKAWCGEAAFARDAAFSREVNQAYDSLCTRWWKEGGAYHAWLEEFKQLQIELAVKYDEYASTTRLNYEIMGIPSDQYQPTEYLKAPLEYLNRATQIFSRRNHAPLSEEPIEECHDGHG